MTGTAAPTADATRQAALGALVILSFAALTKVIAFVKELTLAREFGVGPATDAYVLGFTWVTWLPGIFVSITMATLIPIGRRLQHRSEREGRLFLDEFAGWTLVAGITTGSLIMAAALLQRWLGGDSPAAWQSLGQTVPILAWLVPAAFVAAYCSARLVNTQRHGNVLLETLPPLIIIAYLVGAPHPSLPGLCGATALGYAAYSLAAVALMRVDGQRFSPSFGTRSHGWRELINASLIVIVGNVCAGSLMMADQFQASTLDEGSIATLSFASRLLMLPATLASLAIARSLLPIFSDLAARGETRELVRLVHRFCAAVFAIGCLGAGLVWLVAPWLVETAFQRGEFTAEDTARTAAALRWGIFQLPGYAAAMVVVQALLSQRRYSAVAASGIFNLTGKVALNALLAPAMGVPGITLATALVLSASFVLLLTLLHREPPAGRTRPDGVAGDSVANRAD